MIPARKTTALTELASMALMVAIAPQEAACSAHRLPRLTTHSVAGCLDHPGAGSQYRYCRAESQAAQWPLTIRTGSTRLVVRVPAYIIRGHSQATTESRLLGLGRYNLQSGSFVPWTKSWQMQITCALTDCAWNLVSKWQ